MLIRTGPYRDDAIDSVQKEMLYVVHMRRAQSISFRCCLTRFDRPPTGRLRESFAHAS